MYLINYSDPKSENVCVKANALPSLTFFSRNPVTDEVASENEPAVVETEPVDVAPAQQSASVPDAR